MSRDDIPGLVGVGAVCLLALLAAGVHALRLLNRWLASVPPVNPVARNARERGRIRVRRDGTVWAETFRDHGAGI